MSDLIGRFLSFDEPLGRGLVRVVYYLTLIYLVISGLYALIAHLIRMEWGLLLWVVPRFVFFVLALRLGAELVLAIFSIEARLSAGRPVGGGFEAGLTPDMPAPAPPPSAPVDPS